MKKTRLTQKQWDLLHLLCEKARLRIEGPSKRSVEALAYLGLVRYKVDYRKDLRSIRFEVYIAEATEEGRARAIAGPGRPKGTEGPQKGTTRYGMRRPIRTASPVIREFFELPDIDTRSMADLAVRMGASRETIIRWRQGKRDPNLLGFESGLHELGYRLRIERIENHRKENEDV